MLKLNIQLPLKLYLISSKICLAIIFLTFLLYLPAQTDPGNFFPFSESRYMIPDFGDSYGVVFRDIDHDNWPDLYVVSFRNLNRLFINLGPDSPFLDYTIQSGLGGNLMPYGLRNLELGAAAADLNNDGLADITIAGWGITTQLFLQQKNHRFKNITQESEITLPLDGNGAFWADVNVDGFLDLFITDEHHPNRLFLGDGRGNFTDVSKQWGLDDNSVSQGASFADLDQDGYPDLYVCNWFKPDILYRNTGKNRFEIVPLKIKHLVDSLNSNGVTFGDIDNDGNLDLLVTDRVGHSALYHNDHQPGDTLWRFRDITEQSALHLPNPSYGSVVADFDNDGFQDIWVNSIGPNILYMNQGNNLFLKVFEEACPQHSHSKYYSTGAASADFDLDGDLDLFVSNKDTNSILYVNSSNNSDFIQLQLNGIRSNRDAIGSKIWLYTNDSSLIGFREITGGGGYLSQNSLVVHFGVTGNTPYQAEIRFPSGITKKLTALQKGQRYIVDEYQNPLKTIYRSYQFLYRLSGNRDFWLSTALYLLLIGILVWYVLFSTRRYRWAARHIIIFFTLTILLLYGIFIALQESPIYLRLTIQLLSLFGLFALLSFFMEKIRRLEIQRNKERQLIQHFSQQLIFMKDNKELFEKLVATIQETIKPEFCLVFQLENGQMIKSSGTGSITASQQNWLVDTILQQLQLQNLDKDIHPYSHWDSSDSHFFPIFRDKALFAVLVIGQPGTFQKFSSEDLEVFETLSAQAAIAIENNQYIEETKKLTQQITEAQTREKYLSELEKTYQKLKENNKKLKKLFSDLQNTQSQLVQSEKMASLGQLVAGVAHELNNPISYIYANMKELENYAVAISDLLTLLRQDTSSSDIKNLLYDHLEQLKTKYDFDFIQKDIQALVQESLEGSQRVKNVVQNLRNFSRLDEAAMKWADLHEGLDSTLLLLNNELKNRIEVHKDYHPLPPVYCHPGNINQVFMNILLNAIQAIEEQGNIWIKTEHKTDQVEITIRDDGKGIPVKNQNKVFDPFFTTKPVGKGTGLGLSISYNIIKEHHGQISFSSQEGAGTTFLIRFPISPDLINSSKRDSKHSGK
jgi:two-component system NtrC family sensor kinase